MVGSPNFVRFVYDGDNSAFPVGPGAAAGPPGSAQIEALFHEYFASQGLPSAETPFSGRSDYGPFIAQGIPAGGLFTGAEGIKTAAQAAIYGGTAGIQYDPCYHASCDTYVNNSDAALDRNADAIAHATITYAQNTEAVNGVRGKGNFKPGRRGRRTRTAPTSGGGGLHEDEAVGPLSSRRAPGNRGPPVSQSSAADRGSRIGRAHGRRGHASSAGGRTAPRRRAPRSPRPSPAPTSR